MGILKIKALKDIRDHSLIVVPKGKEALMAKDIADKLIASGYAEAVEKKESIFKFKEEEE